MHGTLRRSATFAIGHNPFSYCDLAHLVHRPAAGLESLHDVMADYIYLLENRLSPAQQRALSLIRNAVRARDLTLFLTGGAVRDLTGGASVRDLDITVQGETTGLRKDLEAAGAIFTGEYAPSQSLFFLFPGGTRVEVGAAVSVSYAKVGKPKYELTSISEDLRRRDFTANAMALSLNEGSYGLLMDPLNGVADIENRELRLVSNYGFIEDPARLMRAVRLSSRLGWQMEERTQQRYENSKQDVDLEVMSKFSRGYEIEEIFHEEDPQRIMRALDAEGWLQKLAPQLQLGKANDAALAEVREKQGQLQTQGIFADSAALLFPLLTAKLPSGNAAALKSAFAREGFAREIDGLEERTRELQTRFSGKEAAMPSSAWRMLYEAEPGLVLSMFYSAKSAAVQARLKTFLTESPTARQRLPYQLMQEMRIVPDMPIYHELLDKVFFELMDGKLSTPEEMKAYLEPFSPPAPPPPLTLRRARVKKEARPSRAKAKKLAATVAVEEEEVGVAQGLMEPGTLTGPDRGDVPTTHEPLAGNVAPLAPGEPEPKTGAGAPAEKKSTSKGAEKNASKGVGKATTVAGSVLAETGSAVAKKLSATPTPAAEAEALLPHPDATNEIARSKSAKVVIPAEVEESNPGAPSGKKVATAPAGKAQGVSTAAKDKSKVAPVKAATKAAANAGTKPGSKLAAKVASKPATKALAAGKATKGGAPAKKTPVKAAATKKTSTPAKSAAAKAKSAGKTAAKPATKPAAKKGPAPAKKSAVKAAPPKRVAAKAATPAKKAAAKPAKKAVKKAAGRR